MQFFVEMHQNHFVKIFISCSNRSHFRARTVALARNFASVWYSQTQTQKNQAKPFCHICTGLWKYMGCIAGGIVNHWKWFTARKVKRGKQGFSSVKEIETIHVRNISYFSNILRCGYKKTISDRSGYETNNAKRIQIW